MIIVRPDSKYRLRDGASYGHDHVVGTRCCRRDHGTTNMRHTIDIPNILTFKVRGHSVALDLNNAKDEATASEIVRRLAMYGLRKFNDASPMGAVAPKDEPGKVAFAKACADNARAMVKDWLAGDFETERGGSETDPVATRARQIALRMVTDKFGKPDKDNENAKADFAYRVREYASNPKIRGMAERQLEAEADLAIDM